jgi:hypothetical protein
MGNKWFRAFATAASALGSKLIFVVVPGVITQPSVGDNRVCDSKAFLLSE